MSSCQSYRKLQSQLHVRQSNTDDACNGSKIILTVYGSPDNSSLSHPYCSEIPSNHATLGSAVCSFPQGSGYLLTFSNFFISKNS
jgi:hypothetical protein